MGGLLSYTLLNPVVTGSLLYSLTAGPPELREKALRILAGLPIDVRLASILTGLKWLFGLGLWRWINAALNRLAFNGWALSTGGKPWEWEKELCVITGGSGGLGQIAARHVIKKGVRVAVMDIQPPPEELMKTGKVFFYKCDITNSESVKEVAGKIKKELGTTTILVNNAGIGKTALITDVSDSQLDKIFQINLLSHWYTVREFLPDMIAGKKGHVISTASMASYVSVSGMVDYCVTKAGAQSFSEGLTQELKWRYKAPYVQVSTINPFWVKTPLIADWVEKKLESRLSIQNWAFPLQNPEVVGKKMADVILSGKGQHVIIPGNNPLMYLAAAARGLPHWLNEFTNDTQKDTAL